MLTVTINTSTLGKSAAHFLGTELLCNKISFDQHNANCYTDHDGIISVPLGALASIHETTGEDLIRHHVMPMVTDEELEEDHRLEYHYDVSDELPF